jgi:NAD(P)-dependent dehydrogenase (short-subunit alcohol dehydrogenase family)
MAKTRVAVVTGAGQGMGRSVALKFAENGIDVVLVGRTAKKLESVAEEISALGQNATVKALDVTDGVQVQSLAESLQGTRVDLLVNCAGEALIKPIEETTEAEWDLVLTTNLKGPFLMVRALLPLLRQSDDASIINIGSKAALGSFPGITAYTASKTGLLGFTRSLAAELREEEIRVVLLCPGPADTPMRWAATPDFDPKLAIAPETIADSVWWLVSLPKGVTTGEVLLQSIHFE